MITSAISSASDPVVEPAAEAPAEALNSNPIMSPVGVGGPWLRPRRKGLVGSPCALFGPEDIPYGDVAIGDSSPSALTSSDCRRWA